MNEREFQDLFVEISSGVIDQFYPKNESAAKGGEPSAGGRRGESMRDFGVLQSALLDALIERRVIKKKPPRS